jgi:lactate dehydrogenase-like 2-hydroxyacid dehydrogenase
MPKVFVTRRIPEPALERIRAACEMDVWESDDPPPYHALIERARGMDGLLCMLTDRIDAPLMDVLKPSLKVISQMAVGYDNIDINAAAQRRIPIGHTPGVLTEATADLAMALLLTAARRLQEGMAYIRDGEWTTWKPTVLLGHDLAGATLGIVGFGRIGKAVAKRARGFDMNILAYSPHLTDAEATAYGAQCTDFGPLLAQSDFVSIHVPLNAETRHLFNKRTFSKMKPTAILINTARGGVVDQAALYEAAANGMIGGAALDVTDPEPMSPNDPLLKLPNVTILPHVGSATLGTRTKMALIAADNLIAGIRGEPLPFQVAINR